MNSATLIKRMQAAGWKLRNVSGSHHIFVHPSRPGHVCVPHPKKDLGIGLVRRLSKQAGIE
jgi:predicted RNA binding protein YcfA (HicA-like mRNA interferase family)